jgi:hypothetical protein
MTETSTASGDGTNEALDHAWQWFEYHATQRVSMMRFSISVLGGVAAAAGWLHQSEAHILAVGIAILGIIFSWCFHRIDCRESALVKLGERALIAEQARLATQAGCGDFNICVAADKTAGATGSYSQILRIIHYSVAVAFLGFSFIEISYSRHVMFLIHHMFECMPRTT